MARNFVVVMTDDQGPWAMPHRMPELVMPHLQRFVDESLDLTGFHCASPVCSPARASLITGRMPSAHGVHDWLIGTEHPDAFPDHYLDGQPTTAEMLHRAGYQCAMVGKWHVGDSRVPAPGFEYWWAHRFGGGPYFDAPIWRDGVEATEPRYLTHAITEEALAFLRNQVEGGRDQDRPFYLQVNYTAPHHPWDAGNHPEEYLALYADEQFDSVPQEPRHPWTEQRRDFDYEFSDRLYALRGYCASLTAVDEGFGQLRTALDDLGLADDTVVIYLSDNGFSCGHLGVWGKGNGTTPVNFFENSVRVPCVVHLPGGRTGATDALIAASGLHPTICELAGVELAPDRWRAGDSFADVLTDERAVGDEVVVVHGEYGGGRMISDGRWKYVIRFDGSCELYDLHLGELENLADEQPAHRQRLHDRLERWFADHERPGASGWDRPVGGHGQIHPNWRGLPPERCYVPPPVTPSS